MISKDEILKLETRKDIYDFILNNPGLHLHEIQRRTNIPLGSLRYHLKFLEKLDLINIKIDKNYKRHYVKNTVGANDKKILNLLRQETTIRIVIMLLMPGPYHIYNGEEHFQKSLKKYETFEKNYSIQDIIDLTKNWPKSDHFHIHKHRTTVQFHLQKLVDINLIEKTKKGKETKYRLKDEDMVWAFLIKYKDALSKKSIDEILNWREDAYASITDKILNVMWEIFPHPLHA